MKLLSYFLNPNQMKKKLRAKDSMQIVSDFNLIYCKFTLCIYVHVWDTKITKCLFKFCFHQLVHTLYQCYPTYRILLSINVLGFLLSVTWGHLEFLWGVVSCIYRIPLSLLASVKLQFMNNLFLNAAINFLKCQLCSLYKLQSSVSVLL